MKKKVHIHIHSADAPSWAGKEEISRESAKLISKMKSLASALPNSIEDDRAYSDMQDKVSEMERIGKKLFGLKFMMKR